MDETNIKISCIIPTFNRSEFLAEALQSVLQQTLKPFEIIIVNNGEGEVKIPSGLHENIIVHTIALQSGASKARNAGVAIAKGNYLAFLDDDDLWGKEYLQNVASAIQKGAICTVSRLDKLTGNTVTAYKNPEGKMRIEKFLVANPGLTGSNVVVSKDVFIKIGGFDANLPTSNDKSFAIELLRSNVSITTLPRNQAVTREHEGEKLTSAEKSARGTELFIQKYRTLMSKRVLVENKAKLFRYRFKSGKSSSFFPYIFYSFLNRIIHYV